MDDAPPLATAGVRRPHVLVIGADGALAGRVAAESPLASAHIGHARSNDEALGYLEALEVDVVLSDPAASFERGLAFADQCRRVRRSARVVVLAPAGSPQNVLTALRSGVFACFTAPFDTCEVAAFTAQAAAMHGWRDGVRVLSGIPAWLSFRVSSQRISAERLVRFMTEYHRGLPDTERDDLMTAFREMLLNAMEHGAGFDPAKVIAVSATRTRRAVLFYFRDPGPGFSHSNLAHAAVAHDGNPIAHVHARIAKGLRPGGFGILLVRKLVDELVYNERGNEVILLKYVQSR